jgi:hypothetical protein
MLANSLVARIVRGVLRRGGEVSQGVHCPSDLRGGPVALGFVGSGRGGGRPTTDAMIFGAQERLAVECHHRRCPAATRQVLCVWAITKTPMHG